MSEPEVPTEGEPELGHHQFTIRSLMILTAAVAGFLALATQAPVIFSVVYYYILLFAFALYRYIVK